MKRKENEGRKNFFSKSRRVGGKEEGSNYMYMRFGRCD